MDATCNAAGPSETVGTVLAPRLFGAVAILSWVALLLSVVSPTQASAQTYSDCKIAGGSYADCRSPDLGAWTILLGCRPRIWK